MINNNEFLSKLINKMNPELIRICTLNKLEEYSFVPIAMQGSTLIAAISKDGDDNKVAAAEEKVTAFIKEKMPSVIVKSILIPP